MLKIAVATSDGISVNTHFGKAQFFRIYEINGENYQLLEIRDAVAACQHQRTHSQTDFDTVISLLQDCKALFVKKIGQNAADYLIQKRVRVFETSAEIPVLIQQIIRQKLL